MRPWVSSRESANRRLPLTRRLLRSHLQPEEDAPVADEPREAAASSDTEENNPPADSSEENEFDATLTAASPALVMAPIQRAFVYASDAVSALSATSAEICVVCAEGFEQSGPAMHGCLRLRRDWDFQQTLRRTLGFSAAPVDEAAAAAVQHETDLEREEEGGYSVRCAECFRRFHSACVAQLLSKKQNFKEPAPPEGRFDDDSSRQSSTSPPPAGESSILLPPIEASAGASSWRGVWRCAACASRGGAATCTAAEFAALSSMKVISMFVPQGLSSKRLPGVCRVSLLPAHS